MSNLFEVKDVKVNEVNDEQNLEVHQDKFLPQSQIAVDLMRDPTVIETSKKVNLDDTVALYDLGKEPADEMAAISKKLLDQLTVADTIASTKVLDSLTKIAGQIEFKELKPENYSGIRGIFHKAENVLKERVAKYQSIGGEVNELFVSLKGYENTIQKRITDMNTLGTANEAYAKNLDQYIAMIYILRNQQEERINNTTIQANNGDQNSQIKLPKLKQAAEVLDKRAYDLEQAKAMATISAPQIVQTQDNNLNLVQQYHSAFITTIPLLQNGLVQAVTALQQNYAQQGLNAQKEATKALFKQQAENLAINNKFIAESSGKAMISVDDMKDILSTIVNSVQETKAIEENNAKQREESRKAMKQMITDAEKAGELNV